jgi:hypothetical protein
MNVGYSGPSAEELYTRGQEAFRRAYTEFKAIKQEDPKPTQQSSGDSVSSSSNELDAPEAPQNTASLFCSLRIKTGRRAGELCGRKRPCQYHDKKPSASETVALGLGSSSCWRALKALGNRIMSIS